MSSFAGSTHGRRICLLEFATIFKLKNNNNNKKNPAGKSNGYNPP